MRAGGAVEIEPVRHLYELLRRNGNRFACRAPADIAHDTVAWGDAGDAGADALDHAGEFRRRRKRKRRLVLIFAGDDQRVEEIQRRRLYAHHRFARAGVRLVDVGQFKFVGGAEMGTEDGFHARFISGFRHSGIMQKRRSRDRCGVGGLRFIRVAQPASTNCFVAKAVFAPGYLIPYSNELD